MFFILGRGSIVKAEEAVMEDSAATSAGQESLSSLQKNEYRISQPISRRGAMAAVWEALFVVGIIPLGFQVGKLVASGASSIIVIRFARRSFRDICIACAVVFLYVFASGFMSAFYVAFARKVI